MEKFLLVHCFNGHRVDPFVRSICHHDHQFSPWPLFYVAHTNNPIPVVSVPIYPIIPADLSKSTDPVPPHWALVPVSSNLLFPITSLIVKLVHSKSLILLDLINTDQFIPHFMPRNISTFLDVVNLHSWLILGF